VSIEIALQGQDTDLHGRFSFGFWSYVFGFQCLVGRSNARLVTTDITGYFGQLTFCTIHEKGLEAEGHGKCEATYGGEEKH